MPASEKVNPAEREAPLWECLVPAESCSISNSSISGRRSYRPSSTIQLTEADNAAATNGRRRGRRAGRACETESGAEGMLDAIELVVRTRNV